MPEWLGGQTYNVEVLSSRPALTTNWSCCSVGSSAGLVCLLPVGILNHVMFYLFELLFCFCPVYFLLSLKNPSRGEDN